MNSNYMSLRNEMYYVHGNEREKVKEINLLSGSGYDLQCVIKTKG